MEKKDRMLKFMQDRYAKSKWALFSLRELRNVFGYDIRNELNQLYREGCILKQPGFNEPQVELIKFG